VILVWNPLALAAKLKVYRSTYSPPHRCTERILLL